MNLMKMLQVQEDKGRIVIVSTGMMAILVVCWVYMIHMAWGAKDGTIHSIVTPGHPHAWGGREILACFLMWFAMMGAMMLPSVAPWVLTLSRISRQENSSSLLPYREATFLSGYFVMWAGYSILAALGQWSLHQNALLTPSMTSANPIFGGLLLIVTGLFQWTPARNACLDHCRSPMGFFLTTWKSGGRGAFEMGLRHGLYCVGCCWALMALSFVAGVMNLVWMGLITIFLLMDLVFVRDRWLDRAAGLVLISGGLWMILCLNG